MTQPTRSLRRAATSLLVPWVGALACVAASGCLDTESVRGADALVGEIRIDAYDRRTKALQAGRIYGRACDGGDVGACEQAIAYFITLIEGVPEAVRRDRMTGFETAAEAADVFDPAKAEPDARALYERFRTKWCELRAPQPNVRYRLEDLYTYRDACTRLPSVETAELAIDEVTLADAYALAQARGSVQPLVDLIVQRHRVGARATEAIVALGYSRESAETLERWQSSLASIPEGARAAAFFGKEARALREAELARQRAAEEQRRREADDRAWLPALRSSCASPTKLDDCAAVDAYLNERPSGRHAAEAQAMRAKGTPLLAEISRKQAEERDILAHRIAVDDLCGAPESEPTKPTCQRYVVQKQVRAGEIQTVRTRNEPCASDPDWETWETWSSSNTKRLACVSSACKSGKVTAETCATDPPREVVCAGGQIKKLACTYGGEGKP